MEFEPNLTVERRRENDKLKLRAFMKGCEFERCLSPDCPHFVGDRKGMDALRANAENALAHAIKMLQINNLRISCVPSNAVLPDELRTFQPLVDFSFHRAINCTVAQLAELAEPFKVAAEALHKAEPRVREGVVQLFRTRREIEFDSLAALFLKKVDAAIFAALVQFLPLLWFCFEIHVFDGMKPMKNMLSKMNFEWLYSADIAKYKPTLVRSPLCLTLAVENLQNTLTMNVLKCPRYFENSTNNDEFRLVCDTLNFLNEVNGLFKRHEIVGRAEFENESVVTETDLKVPLLVLLRGAIPRRMEAEVLRREKANPNIGDFNFLNYPFLFPIEVKVEVLKLESILTQDTEIETTLFSTPFSFDNYFTRNHIYFELLLRRSNLIEDALNQLGSKANAQKLKKPLRVKFVNEPGVDEGGLTKEFFELAIAQLFKPEYGMFVVKNERYWWFDHRSLEVPLNFHLVGILLGLALYNQIILGLNLAPAIYDKIKLAAGSVAMADRLGLEDLADLEPELAASLRNTLRADMDASEFPVFFVAPFEYFGETRLHDLVPGGATVRVTNANKAEFVEKYLDWFFHKSVAPQFDPFFRGFQAVMNSRVVKMFNGFELNLAIFGKEDLDFDQLKKTARYDDGYTDTSPAIRNFWTVVAEFDDTQKKDFLKFITGSFRAPIKGLSEVKMVISRNGPDSELLPTAHTCFNHLLLPDYASLAKLRDKLVKAIQHSEGFGLF